MPHTTPCGSLGTYLALVGGALVIDSLPFYTVFAKPAVLVAISAALVHFFAKEKPPSHLIIDEQSRELQDMVVVAGGNNGGENGSVEISEVNVDLEPPEDSQAPSVKGFFKNMQRVSARHKP